MFNRQQNIQIETSKTKKRFFVNQIYPDVEITNSDNYVITTVEDRLDLLALDFYGDDHLWIVIAAANSLPGDSIFPPAGIQLRIPSDPSKFISDYAAINQVR